MTIDVNNAQRGNWMQTYTGKQFFPLDPLPEDVDIIDIAHALSHICRFGGHCERFYSVAEHSVYVSMAVDPQYSFTALMHDAAEAYVMDVPRPLKAHLIDHGWIEDGVWRVIARKFELPEVIPDEVWVADNAVLLAEAQQILKEHPEPWDVPGTPAHVIIQCLSPEKAKEMFLARFKFLQFWRSVDG